MYRFTLYNRAGQPMMIDEPVGWDGQKYILARDAEYHGIMFEHGSDLVYVGDAARAIREEEKQYGTEGSMRLKIEGFCGGVWEEGYNGKLDFEFFETEYPGCKVKLPAEATGDVMSFKNNIDKKVNLASTSSLNGVALTPYTHLGIYKSVPSKSVYVENLAKRDNLRSDIYQGDHSGGGTDFTFPQLAVFIPAQEVEVSSEIGGFAYPFDNVTPEYEIALDISTPTTPWELPYEMIIGGSYNYIDLDRITPIVNYDRSLGAYHGPFTNGILDFHIQSASITQRFNGPNAVTPGVEAYNYFACVRHPDDSVTWLSTSAGTWKVVQPTVPFTAVGGTVSLNKTVTVSGISMKDGDRLYVFGVLISQKAQAQIAQAAFTMVNGAGNYIKFSVLSTAPPTDTKFFFVNEALSRIAESITDGNVRVLSTYFGRTNSQPYSHGSDGCGSLEGLTTGKFLRRLELKYPTTPPILSASFKDMLNGLNPIHNIGFDFRTDTNPGRTGKNLIRIEKAEFFYEDDIAFECRNIDKVSIKLVSDRYYGIIRIGYDKWEGEQYNGIDEFMTRREYRTTLDRGGRKTLEKVSPFIASSFAIEITRRLGNETSEDWRYDDDIFIVCFKKDGSTIAIEQGAISSAQNILDPGTLLNYRISPVRNLIRWLPTILAGYKGADANSKLVFTDGTGNFYAAGKLNSTFCNNENTVISEMGEVKPSLLTTPNTALPIWDIESVTYDWPLNMAEWNYLKDNRYKKILASTDGIEGTGWLDRLEFSPYKKKAQFTLKPDRNSWQL